MGVNTQGVVLARFPWKGLPSSNQYQVQTGLLQEQWGSAHPCPAPQLGKESAKAVLGHLVSLQPLKGHHCLRLAALCISRLAVGAGPSGTASWCRCEPPGHRRPSAATLLGRELWYLGPSWTVFLQGCVPSGMATNVYPKQKNQNFMKLLVIPNSSD